MLPPIQQTQEPQARASGLARQNRAAAVLEPGAENRSGDPDPLSVSMTTGKY